MDAHCECATLHPPGAGRTRCPECGTPCCRSCALEVDGATYCRWCAVSLVA